MSDGDTACRFVLLRLGDRQVALALEAVLGLSELDGAVLGGSLPPLLQNAHADLVTAVGVRDRQLLLVLQAAAIVPDGVWQALQAAG